jgi:hypothetical protein
MSLGLNGTASSSSNGANDARDFASSNVFLIAFATELVDAQYQPPLPLPRRLKAAILLRPEKDVAGGISDPATPEPQQKIDAAAPVP